MKKILKVNIFFLVLILLQIKGAYILVPLRKAIKFNMGSLLLTTQILFLVIPIIIYLILTRQSVKKTLRLNALNGKSVGVIIGIGLLFIPIAQFLSYLTSFFFYNNVQDVFNKLSNFPLIAMLLIVAFTPAMCEELTMRGVILSGYDSVSLWKAAVINGFLFAVLHLNPPQFLYAFVLGIILACVVRITNSIFASMIIHFMFNGLNTILSWALLKTLSSSAVKESQKYIPMSARIAVLIFYLVIAIIAGIVIVQLMKKLIKINNGNMRLITSGEGLEENTGGVTFGILSVIPIIISSVIYLYFVSK